MNQETSPPPPPDTESTSALILDFKPLELGEINANVCCLSPLIYGIVITA